MAADIGELKPVYLIYGTEERRLAQALDRLKRSLSEVADLDFNLVTLRGESTSADEIIAAANTMPFMSDRRLVIVRDIERLSKVEIDRLVAYLRNPSPTTTLVLVGEKVDKRTALYSAVETTGVVAEYRAPKKSEYPQQVVEMFEARGRRIGRDAAEALVRAVGYDLSRLSLEVDKVVAYAGDERTLSRSEVEEVMSSTAGTSIFEFLDALGSRDCRTALERLNGLLDQGETIYSVHALAVRRVRDLLSTQALMRRGQSSTGALAAVLRRQEWQVRDFPRQARRFESDSLTAALIAAARTEAEMKTSRDARLAFERWIFSVCEA